MAKRLTDTEKWNDDWYISLSNDYRIIWQWLIDNCSHAGICKRSMKLLNMMCNTSITEEEMLIHMSERVVVVGNNWFIPKFIKFQYSTLESARPVILSVVNELEKYGLLVMIVESLGNDIEIIKRKRKDKVTVDNNNAQLVKTGKNGKSKNGFVDIEAQREREVTERINANPLSVKFQRIADSR